MKKILLSVALTLASSITAYAQEPVHVVADRGVADQPKTTAGPGQPNEPLGGQPPAGSSPSVKDWDYEIKRHRAFEAVLWNMPAVAIYSLRRAAFDGLGMKDN